MATSTKTRAIPLLACRFSLSIIWGKPDDVDHHCVDRRVSDGAASAREVVAKALEYGLARG